MPSPFPGMDPYLEGNEWTSVHHELTSEIARQLAPKLRPKYIARAVRRFVTEETEELAITTGNIYPDVGVYDAGRGKSIKEVAPALTAPIEIETTTLEIEPQVTVEIRDVANRQLVTAIEVLSPTNKRDAGYQKYVEKRQGLLASRAHLLEIDLHRSGKRVPMRKPLPKTPYFVFLSRANRRPITEIWPIQLRDRLPLVPVPLLSGDPDVMLDLQSALDMAYDAYGYDLSVDYTRPPDVPFTTEEAQWAADMLRVAGVAAP